MSAYIWVAVHNIGLAYSFVLAIEVHRQDVGLIDARKLELLNSSNTE